MTNAEKFLKDGVDTDDFVGEFNDFCAMQTSNQASSVRLAQFLSRTIKPTLSEDEKVILNIFYKRGYIKISRDIDDDIYLKNDGRVICCIIFNELFQFIKERRRI